MPNACVAQRPSTLWPRPALIACITCAGLAVPTLGSEPPEAKPATQTATPVQPAKAALSKEVRLAIKTATAKLQEMASTDDVAKQKEIAQAARERLRTFYADPTNEDLEAWRLLGIIAVTQEDKDLAALAFYHIDRLKPDALDDEQLSNLIVKLDLLGASARTRDSASATKGFLAYWKQAKQSLGSFNVDPRPCYYVAFAFRSGFGVPKDISEAERWYRNSSRFDSDSCIALGLMYDFGEGVSKDQQQAASWYDKAYSLDTSSAFYRIHFEYPQTKLIGADKVDKYIIAAKAGSVPDMIMLGHIYYVGDGVPTDREQSLKWYQIAADAGDIHAMFILGERFNLDAEQPLAERWLRKAAAAGHENSMFNLGVLLYERKGDPKLKEEAVTWFRKAKNSGSLRAAVALATCYYLGDGIIKDKLEAIKLLRNACARGSPIAMRMLGQCHRFGTGVDPDQDRAESRNLFQRSLKYAEQEAERKLK